VRGQESERVKECDRERVRERQSEGASKKEGVCVGGGEKKRHPETSRDTQRYTKTNLKAISYIVLFTQCDTKVTQVNTGQHSATHCNTLQHTATHCNTPIQTRNPKAISIYVLSHTHCNTLQHTAT